MPQPRDDGAPVSASPYEILFEPVKIGPLVARNRFFQVPHCNGMGTIYPRTQAAMREVKAEGGWAVVCTEEAMIHPDSESTPVPNCELFDRGDIRPLALIAEAIKRHGALAGIELVHHGFTATNRLSRLAPVAPSSQPNPYGDPIQSRIMDKADIRAFRRRHRTAAVRAREAGYDIVYVYAAHNIALPMHFISRRYNHRTDEYGGALENRVRLLRELLEETREAVGDACAVALRFAVDELLGPRGITCEGEGREVVEMLAELPDLWDVNISDWDNDSQTSRFAEEGFQDSYIAFVKGVTTKPVVGVGRYTSPDAMVGRVRRGLLDFIGAARPSIADPYLPEKIRSGRVDEIRECIGCNVCVSGNNTGAPMRCTQNATVGEEWRRGWHPERFAPRGSDDSVLIVGAGPAGLECARVLGERGYAVHLAEAGTVLGGRVAAESRLAGLAAWRRVVDYRASAIGRMANVSVYFDSRLEADHLREFGAAHLVIATGARWRRDGTGRANLAPIPGWERDHVVSADAVLAGAEIAGPVVVFDDDHYYLGGVIAETLRLRGLAVTLATPEAEPSTWTRNTLEQTRIETRLREIGVEIATRRNIARIDDDALTLACVFTGTREERACATLVMVTARDPEDALYHALVDEDGACAAAGVKSVTRIGDCLAPGIIAAAVHDGHRYARALDTPPEAPDATPYLRERVSLE